jgi:hypothetical protein
MYIFYVNFLPGFYGRFVKYVADKKRKVALRVKYGAAEFNIFIKFTDFIGF